MNQHKNSKQKPKKLPARKDSISRGVVAPKRRVAVHIRPLHHHIAFHPANILALLCLGILLVSLTMNALADSYVVNAVVPAQPLTAPAIITVPTDGAQTSIQALSVGGTCPNSSYVSLRDNATFVGQALCASGSFSIALDLSVGNNDLQVQDYNFFNAPGPASGMVTITYAPPVTPAVTSSPLPTIGSPTALPTALLVTKIDSSVPYSSSNLETISSRPTVSGIAPPYTIVTVKLRGKNVTCTTRANQVGYWSCVLMSVPEGKQTFEVSGITLAGTRLTFPDFDARVAPGTASTEGVPIPFLLTASYGYSVYSIGQPINYTVQIIGGSGPYAFTVDWGDGNSSTFIHQTGGNFTLSHMYGWINSASTVKKIQVEAVDGYGQPATLEFSNEIRNPAFGSTVARVTRSTGLWGLLSALRPWLWVLWPGYGVVVLLVFSFWLGEEQERAQLQSGLRTLSTKPTRQTSRAHAHR